jgi:hypothetical protein
MAHEVARTLYGWMAQTFFFFSLGLRRFAINCHDPCKQSSHIASCGSIDIWFAEER